MKRVLVLDALQRSALAVTRSLGRHGVPLVTADESETALAGASKYSQVYFSYPPPGNRPEDFVSYISNKCREYDISLILPMTELTTMLLLKHRYLFINIEIPFPDIDIVDSLADKCSLLRLAETLGIRYPRTVYAGEPDSLPDVAADLRYPVVLKPCRSWVEYNGKWIRAAVRHAASANEAAAIVESDPSFRACPFMLQEFVPGSGYGVFALYDSGRPLAFFAHRRIREKPPRGGVSVFSESIAVDPQLLDQSRALLEKACWHGAAMVEFRVASDGTPWLMEVNTRFWGSLQLSVDAGMDFPRMLYRMGCGERVEAVEGYRTGLRLRWLLGDMDNLYLTIRDGEYTAGEKLRAVGRFLRPSPRRTRHEVGRWSDWHPFWWEIKHYLSDIFRTRP